MNSLTWLIVPHLEESLPYFGKDTDLCLASAYNMEEGIMEFIQFEYLNLIAAYMFHALAESQSLGMLSRMSGTWTRSWRKTLMRLTGPGLSRTHQRDHCIRYFAFHRLRMPPPSLAPRERRYLEGQGFSCLRAGYVGPRKHV
jgi:hypothetical protein